MLERIGEYEVTGRLGAGAMGVVLRVRHVRLGAERALKVLNSTTPDRLQRFEREVRALADVQHKNVVAVHEAGQHGGRPFFVMDLVEGEPLDHVLRRGRLPLERALQLGSGLARGLVALHARGVVHRDLKPGNVMVRPDGEPVILDLGLALSPESDERLTRTGALVGTLGYMAPEQLLGQRATSACDVYALGAILFEAASGEPLVDGNPTLQSMITAVVEGRSRSLSGVGPDLPEALDALVARLLAREPSARPDATSVVRALDDPGLRSGRSVGAARRRARLVKASLGLAAVVVVGAGVIAAQGPGSADAGPAGSTREGVAAAETQGAGGPAAPPAPDPAEVTRALERALHAPQPADRAPALAAWLRANPGHARRDEALSAWRDARRRAPLSRWQLVAEGRANARFADDRRVLAWVSLRPGLWIADAWTGAVATEHPDLELQEVARDPRGGVLMAVDGKRLRRLAPGSGDLVDDLPLPRRGRVQGLLVTDTRVVALQHDVARVLDRASGRVLHEVGPIGDAPKSLALCDGGRVLVVASGPHVFDQDPDALAMVRGYDVTTGALLFEQHAGDRTSLLLGGPDAGFVAGTTAGLLAIFAPDGERQVQFTGEGVERGFAGTLLGGVAHEACLRDAYLADGGRRLVSLAGHYQDPRRGDLRCWDTATGREVVPAARWSWGGCSLDLSPDERVIAVGLASGAVEVWAAPHREPELDLEPEEQPGTPQEEAARGAR